MERQPQNFRKSGRAHLLLGIILMFLGLLLIADIANIFPDLHMRDYIFTWQALLIFLGVILVSNKDSKGTGLILIAIGSFFMLPWFFELPHYWRSLFWPSILILVGLLIIFGGRGHGHGGSYFGGHRRRSSSEDYLDDVTVFGGGDKMINSQNFQGGKITHIFGGSKYDFTNAQLAKGKNYLELVMIFGGSKLIIPEGWDVRVEITSIFGGFSDKRVKSMVARDTERILVLTGVNIFGGGEIVNYL